MIPFSPSPPHHLARPPDPAGTSCLHEHGVLPSEPSLCGLFLPWCLVLRPCSPSKCSLGRHFQDSISLLLPSSIPLLSIPPPSLLPQHSNIPGLCQLPKPATNSFSGVGSAYQTHHGNLAGYEDVAAVSAHDYTKPYNAAPSALGKPDSDLSTFKQPYDSKPAGANAFNNYGLLQVRGGHPCLHCMRGRAVLWLCGKGEGRDCIEVYVGEGPVLWYVRRGRDCILTPLLDSLVLYFNNNLHMLSKSHPV